MKPKSLYLPVLVLAFLLASEMPKVNGLNRFLNILGIEVTNFLRQTAEMLDALLTKPIPEKSSLLDHEKILTSLLKPDSMEVRETEEASPKPDINDESKDKSYSTDNNKSESGDNKNSVENSSSADTTDEVIEKSSSTENNKRESGDTTDESKEKSSSTENNKSESGDNKSSGEKNSSTESTDEKKKPGEKCKCKRRNK